MLAAANSVFGRWDDTKGEDNIDFMPTILSRFDMIFIIKDQHDQQRDMVRKPKSFLNPHVVIFLNFLFIFKKCLLDLGSSCDERSPQCSNTDRECGRRNSSDHLQKIHCLCQSVSLFSLSFLRDYFLCSEAFAHVWNLNVIGPNFVALSHAWICLFFTENVAPGSQQQLQRS